MRLEQCRMRTSDRDHLQTWSCGGNQSENSWDKENRKGEYQCSSSYLPRKGVWINLDPPPSKDYDIWIKGDCQRIPTLYDGYERLVEQQEILKSEETKRKEEEKVRVVEERQEKRQRKKLRKEENQRERQQRKEQKELEQAERQRRELERKQRKAEKEAEKARRDLERAIRPVKYVDAKESKWTRPLSPPLSYDTDSTLSSPSLSDIEFASFVESTSKKTASAPQTPSTMRVIEYLPTPAPTPQKGALEQQEQDSPLKTKKRKLQCMEESNDNPCINDCDSECIEQRRDSMSIRFLMGTD